MPVSVSVNQLPLPPSTSDAIPGTLVLRDSTGDFALKAGKIVNADINASAAILGTKVAPNFGSQNVTTTGSLTAGAPSVISVNSSSDALRITQVGSGRALSVEDSANPDATPTIIGSDGTVVVGAASGQQTQDYNGSSVSEKLQIQTFGDYKGISIQNYVDGSGSSALSFSRSRSGVLGEQAANLASDRIGTIVFSASDGTAFARAADVQVQVDSTPGSGSMPGRIVFRTTPSGSTAPAERLRIDSAGTLVVADGGNISAGTTTGTKIGTAAGQKLAFYNATPIVQPAGANQAALTNSTGGTADGTLAAVSGSGADTDINNNFTELHVLLNEIRTALVNLGLIKGAA